MASKLARKRARKRADKAAEKAAQQALEETAEKVVKEGAKTAQEPAQSVAERNDTLSAQRDSPVQAPFTVLDPLGWDDVLYLLEAHSTPALTQDPPPDPEPTPVCHAVLDTTELLEAILLILPTKDLLLAQHINRHFKSVIDVSIQLQRALFFQPEPVTAEHLEPRKGPRINPLFAVPKVKRPHVLPIFHFGDLLADAMHIWGAYVCQTADEPFIESTAGSPDAISGIEAFVDMRTLNPRRSRGGRAAFPSGSWRKMFLSQPPCNVSVMVQNEERTLELSNCDLKAGEIWSPWSYFDGQGRVSFDELDDAINDEYPARMRMGIAEKRELRKSIVASQQSV